MRGPPLRVIKTRRRTPRPRPRRHKPHGGRRDVRVCVCVGGWLPRRCVARDRQGIGRATPTGGRAPRPSRAATGDGGTRFAPSVRTTTGSRRRGPSTTAQHLYNRRHWRARRTFSRAHAGKESVNNSPRTGRTNRAGHRSDVPAPLSKSTNGERERERRKKSRAAHSRTTAGNEASKIKPFSSKGESRRIFFFFYTQSARR